MVEVLDITLLHGLEALRIVEQVPDLMWPTVGGGERGLQFLSLDYVGNGGIGNSPISELDELIGQNDLRFLSLRGNLIDNVRPLLELPNLEVLRLDDNGIRDIEAESRVEIEQLVRLIPVLGECRDLRHS